MSTHEDARISGQADPRAERDRQILTEAQRKGPLASLAAFIRLSGPGWLQSAITMGGGSLSSSLYLGVLAGVSLLWVQPIAMILGVIMLSAIAYVTLSTEQRPLRAINRHVNPVLGWAWLLSAMTANLVWSMPQFALGTAAIQQNLLPNVFGPDVMPDPWGKLAVVTIILAVTITVAMLYGIAGWGVKLFEVIVKLMVAMIVLCFFGVVVKMSTVGVLDWGSILRGFIPNFRLLFEPAETLEPYITAVQVPFQDFWRETILSQQRQVMISATSAAVGINMTFLLPYSMLRKGWGRHFRGLAMFDLSTGLFIPFILATGCVVIASASQFHAVPARGFLGETDQQGQVVQPAKNLVAGHHVLIAKRLKFELGEDVFSHLTEDQERQRIEALPAADKKMAAILVERDAFNLADALAPLTGRGFAQYVFGIGIFGMALGAVTMLMLINGLCVCEMLNRPLKGWPQRIGSLMVSVGVLGVFFWSRAKLWLAVPTSVFNMTLLPVAYLTFYLLMNNKTLLGSDAPAAGKRIVWNLAMGVACLAATFISFWTIWSAARWVGIAAVAAFVGLALTVQVLRPKDADS